MQLPIQPKPTHQVKPQLNMANLSNGSIGIYSRMIFSGKLQMAEVVVGNWDGVASR
jgi:hypothetical protein